MASSSRRSAAPLAACCSQVADQLAANHSRNADAEIIGPDLTGTWEGWRSGPRSLWTESVPDHYIPQLSPSLYFGVAFLFFGVSLWGWRTRRC
jgi:hypothetical protein